MKQKALLVPVVLLVLIPGLYAAYCIVGSQSGSLCNDGFFNIRSSSTKFMVLNTVAFASILITIAVGIYQFKTAGKLLRVLFIALIPLSILAIIISVYIAGMSCVGFSNLTF